MAGPRERHDGSFRRHLLLDCSDRHHRASKTFWTIPQFASCSAHESALAITAERAVSSVVTTDEVLAEYLTFFSTSPEQMRRQAAGSVQDLLDNPTIRVMPQSRGSFLSGLELYIERPDKRYSLTDCISMQTMRREGLTEVLTNDRHFEQEGFLTLFRDESSPNYRGDK